MRTIKLENGKEVKISEESYEELSNVVNELRTPDNILFEKIVVSVMN